MGYYWLHFLQHHNIDKEVYDYLLKPIKQLNLTAYDIEKFTNNAFESAKIYVL
jgi:hypothetical protein